MRSTAQGLQNCVARGQVLGVAEKHNKLMHLVLEKKTYNVGGWDLDMPERYWCLHYIRTPNHIQTKEKVFGREGNMSSSTRNFHRKKKDKDHIEYMGVSLGLGLGKAGGKADMRSRASNFGGRTRQNIL
jgi:hypothetical protein